jgi:hypothetical protein
MLRISANAWSLFSPATTIATSGTSHCASSAAATIVVSSATTSWPSRVVTSAMSSSVSASPSASETRNSGLGGGATRPISMLRQGTTRTAPTRVRVLRHEYPLSRSAEEDDRGERSPRVPGRGLTQRSESTAREARYALAPFGFRHSRAAAPPALPRRPWVPSVVSSPAYAHQGARRSGSDGGLRAVAAITRDGGGR